MDGIAKKPVYELVIVGQTWRRSPMCLEQKVVQDSVTNSGNNMMVHKMDARSEWNQ